APRQQQIRAALGLLPNVAIRFSDPAAVSEEGTAPQSLDSPPAASAPSFQASLERALGGHGLVEQFSSQLLDINEAVMSRAYALRRLAQRFPAEAEPSLDPESRRLLRQLGREHVDALAQVESGMEQLLIPVLTSLGGSAATLPRNEGSGATWQGATEDLFQDAHRVETLLGSMLDVSPRTGSTLDLPSRMRSDLARLRAGLERYRSLVSDEPGGAGK